jgi:hypothetical protein
MKGTDVYPGMPGEAAEIVRIKFWPQVSGRPVVQPLMRHDGRLQGAFDGKSRCLPRSGRLLRCE